MRALSRLTLPRSDIPSFDAGDVASATGVMNMVKVESLETVGLRSIWGDEAKNFTPWLAANPQHLADVLGMDLEVEGQEVAVGPFSADIIMREANSGHRIVVENMLERTDHDHLGKLITYAAGMEASYAVLISSEFRPEHRSALTWLNSLTAADAGFFGVEVSAVRILDSPAAVRLDVVVEPDDWSRQIRASANAEESETQTRYRRWWAEFLPQFHDRYPGWSSATKAQAQNWMNFPAGRSGMNYSVVFSWPTGADGYRLKACIYLDPGEQPYQYLLQHKPEIEASFGGDLTWEPLEGRRAARVGTHLIPADPADEERWPEYRQWAIDSLGRVRDALGPHIGKIGQ